VLEFFCFDDQEQICADCIKGQHAEHQLNYLNVCAFLNREILESLLQQTSNLQLMHKSMRQESIRTFKSSVRREILALKTQCVESIDAACNRILNLTDKGELKGLEREIDLFQKFISNKVVLLKQKIRLNLDQIQHEAADPLFDFAKFKPGQTHDKTTEMLQHLLKRAAALGNPLETSQAHKLVQPVHG
jgi:B-box zinc finger